MQNLLTLPEWIGGALITASIAALSYALRQLIETVGARRAIRRARLARLASLLALLRSGRVAFEVQCEKRDELAASIHERRPDTARQSYDRLFARAFDTMTPAERELHAVVRATTMHAIRPLNESLLAWLAADDYYRVRLDGSPDELHLADFLRELEVHLLLWHAKYEAWMSDPSRALVYLDDEARHGSGFPQGGPALVTSLLGTRGAGSVVRISAPETP